MRLRFPILILLVALLPAMLGGCATERRSDDLRKTLDAYASTLRWDGLAAGAVFLSPQQRDEHPLSPFDIARYDQLRVSGYDVQGTLPGGADTYRQVVSIGLINRNTQIARTIIDKQTWKWDAKDRHWWLVSGLPNVTQGD